MAPQFAVTTFATILKATTRFERSLKITSLLAVATNLMEAWKSELLFIGNCLWLLVKANAYNLQLKQGL
jgi:hypothetical protein